MIRSFLARVKNLIEAVLFSGLLRWLTISLLRTIVNLSDVHMSYSHDIGPALSACS